MLTPAIRALRGTPAFSFVAIATMAVAIAANTAIFAVCDQLVLHPVSMPDPDSLVALWLTNPQTNLQAPAIAFPRYEHLKGRIHAFSSFAASAFDSFTLVKDSDATQLNGLRVSASFLPTLGVLPAQGRNFTAAEDIPNGPNVCIISHELWQTEFGGRGGMVGHTIQLNGTAWEVIGIMPPRVSAPFTQVQVYAPRLQDISGLTPQQVQIGATFASAIARLAPGATLAQARAEMDAANVSYREQHPGNLEANRAMDPRPFVATVASGIAPTMYTLLGAVACVLLIACANVASLFLSRLLKRRKEIAVRMSLGATRTAIVRQFLAESLLFSAVAGLAGTLLAVWTLKALNPIVSTQLPPNAVLVMHWRALVFSGAVTIVSALLTGLFPALQASRPDLVEQLKDSTRGSSSGHGGRFRQALIVAEVTLSIVLLVGAGLLMVSFVRLQSSTLGFHGDGVASAFVGLPTGRYSTPTQQADFFERVIETLRAQPGVVNAAASLSTPLNGGIRSPYGILGQPPKPISERPLTLFNVVSEEYFRLLEIPIREGRAFTADDRATSPNVCIISETFARHLFPGKSAIGRILLFGGNDRHVEIVGVAGDVKSVGVSVPVADETYFPIRQLAKPGMNIVGRVNGRSTTLQASMRRAVSSVDRTQAIAFFTTMESALETSLGTQRLVATLTAIFSGLALLLSLTGLYSVLAFLVSHRTPEIGIRMALGATRTRVVRMVMTSGLTLVGIGLALGIGLAAATSRLIQQLLFGVSGLSIPIYAAVAASFAIVAAMACLVPSLRASRIDPVVAFRAE